MWGCGDFGGGLLTRRTPLFGVVLISQFVGMALALALALVRGETAPLPAIAAVGVLDMAGIGAFLLAIQMGSLAVAAVLSSLYPVTTVILAAAFLRERVTMTHAIGIALAMVAVACIAAGTT